VDVLVVDDGSTDNSGDLAEDAGAEVVRLAMNMGAWTAIQTGFRYALLKGYTAVVTMDGDGQHFAESIPLLIKQLTTNQADVIIGSNPERASRNRQMSWAFFRMLTSFDLKDFTSGLKAYNDRAMALLLRPRAHLFDYQDLGTLLLIRRAGLTVCEVPVPMQKRLYGSSRIFFNWWQVIRYMMLSTVLCISKYRQ
jgi:glycosyltransferase involved in cell wall biosynthesis